MRRRRRRESSWGRWFGVILLVVVAAFFSFLNAGERATLDLGFTILYRVSLVGLVFGSFLLGMITMFLFGLQYDRKVRDALREPSRRPSADETVYFDSPPDLPT